MSPPKGPPPPSDRFRAVACCFVTDTCWVLGRGDVVALRAVAARGGALNMVEIGFVDADTGAQRTVTATDEANRTRYGTAFARHVAARRPLSQAEAQDIADRALSILGGRPRAKWVVTVDADRLLGQGEDEKWPAADIADFDTVDIDLVPMKAPLLIQVLGNDRAGGKIELALTDGSDGRLEMELELMNLARRH